MSSLTKAKLFARGVLTPFARKILGEPQRNELELTEVAGFTVVHRKCEPDERILREQLAVDHFLPAVPDYKPGPGHVLIDLGAHLGSFAMIVGKTGAVVHAIEARRETFNLLRINAKMNHLDTVRAHHLALSDCDGECQLYYSWDGNWGDSIVDVTTVGSETVPAQTLTHFMAEHRIERCNLLKSNCEGAEFRVLLSTGPDVLARIDRMIVLYHCDLEKQIGEDVLVRHLESSGFRTTITNRDENRGWIIASRV